MRRVRGRLKSPDPEKESRWQKELPRSWTAPVPPTHPSLSSYSTSVQKTLRGFEVEECLNAGLVHVASEHKTSPTTLSHEPLELRSPGMLPPPPRSLPLWSALELPMGTSLAGETVRDA
ncbi:hypothetical protein NQZ68_000305 [Dissostichus eleginoides]|nr:hypothetical protein NQZ68_000305 [Dissostichus eleginoides]